jgi:hypothetical protein
MRISINHGSQELAYMISEDQVWTDPWGGLFSAAEQQNMTNFIRGKDDGIVLGASGYSLNELRIIVKP